MLQKLPRFHVTIYALGGGVPSHCGERQPTPSLSAPTWAITLHSLPGPEQLGSWKLLKTRGQEAQIPGCLCHHELGP